MVHPKGWKSKEEAVVIVSIVNELYARRRQPPLFEVRVLLPFFTVESVRFLLSAMAMQRDRWRFLRQK